jgi:hypothetical protein
MLVFQLVAVVLLFQPVFQYPKRVTRRSNPPPIRPPIPINFDRARTFDYRQPDAPNNGRPLHAGSTAVFHGIRVDAKVQLGMLVTRVFAKGLNVDVQIECDRLVANLPIGEHVAQYTHLRGP